MRSYSLKNFQSCEIEALRIAEEVVARLPDLDEEGRLVRCHEVARVVQSVVGSAAGISLWVQDGQYGFCDHSWLWTSRPESDAWLQRPDRFSCPNILDPYCVGSLPQVRLVDCSTTALPHFGMMYRLEQHPREDVRHEWVGELARRMVGEIREFLAAKKGNETCRS